MEQKVCRLASVGAVSFFGGCIRYFIVTIVCLGVSTNSFLLSLFYDSSPDKFVLMIVTFVWKPHEYYEQTSANIIVLANLHLTVNGNNRTTISFWHLSSQCDAMWCSTTKHPPSQKGNPFIIKLIYDIYLDWSGLEWNNHRRMFAQVIWKNIRSLNTY